MLPENITLESAVVFLAFVLYLIVGVSYLCKQEYAWSLVWTSYAIANLGLMLAAK